MQRITGMAFNKIFIYLRWGFVNWAYFVIYTWRIAHEYPYWLHTVFVVGTDTYIRFNDISLTRDNGKFSYFLSLGIPIYIYIFWIAAEANWKFRTNWIDRMSPRHPPGQQFPGPRNWASVVVVFSPPKSISELKMGWKDWRRRWNALRVTFCWPAALHVKTFHLSWRGDHFWLFFSVRDFTKKAIHAWENIQIWSLGCGFITKK